MTEFAKWQDDNTRYLANAVAQLRVLLERHTGSERDSTVVLPTASPPQETRKSRWRLFSRRAESGPGESGAVDRKAIANSSGDSVTVGSTFELPPALVLLGERLGLARFEQEILLLCVAMELDPGMAALCVRAHGEPTRPYPTFALALTLFPNAAWDALSPERALRYWRLIEINQPAAQPLTTSALRVDERILSYLKGLNYLDDRLAALLTAVNIPEHGIDLPLSQRSGVELILRALKQRAGDHSLPVIQLLGPDGLSKQLVAGHAAHALGLRTYRLPTALLPGQAAEIETLARLWQRESLLMPIALYLDASGAEGDAPDHVQALNRLLERLHGVVFLDTYSVWPNLWKPSLPVEVANPAPAEQQAAWVAALGPQAENAPGLLSGQFNLDIARIRQIADGVLSEPADGHDSLEDRLWDACLAATRPRIDNLAQRIEPKARWDDIVLPTTEKTLLRQIADQVAQRSTVYESWGFSRKMSRGLGISVLFSGASGCGKTMAAEVLANHLRLNLYRIDLSAVASKWVGQTAKNLRRLFDAAELGGCILFFDEAECLFSKRSEVKDAHDRYANTEIDYLLQRMEAYRGLAILATNMKSALDPAFMRRLRFVVNFSYPGTAERKDIWKRVFPAETPTEDLDFDRLARLNLTGGDIRNIALNAAFLAAQGVSGTAITMPLVLAAARTEFRKLDRTINEPDFRWTDAPGLVA